MPPTTHSLSRHLLKRSDLDQLGVPTEQVVRWLANGWLEQIGTLPIDDPQGDVVFAVADPDLREDLTRQLQALGRAEVVVSPTRARSLLLRCSLLGAQREHAALEVSSPPSAAPDRAPTDGEPGPRDLLAEVFADSRVVEALAGEAEAIAHEVSQLLASAREAARLDLLDAVSAAVAESQPLLPHVSEPTNADGEPAPGEQAERDPEPEPSAPEPPTAPAEDEDGADLDADDGSADDAADDFFDADDLLDAFGRRGREPAQESTSARGRADFGESTLPVEPALAGSSGAAGASSQDSEPASHGAAANVDAEPEVPATMESAATTGSTTELDELLIAPAVEPPTTDFAPAATTETFRESGAEAALPDPMSTTVAGVPPAVEVHEATVGRQLAGLEPATATTTDTPPIVARESASGDMLQEVTAALVALRTTLTELAGRPPSSPTAATPPSPLDVQPLVAALQQGAATAEAAAAAQSKALESIDARLDRLGERIEHGVALAVHAAIGQRPAESPTTPVILPWTAGGSPRSTMALMALCVLVTAWSAVLWLKTGDSRLALGTLVAANAIGCVLLLGRRR